MKGCMKIGIDMRCFVGGRISGVEEYARNLIEEMISTSQEHEYILFYNAFSSKKIDFSWATHHSHVRLVRRYFPNKLLNLFLWYFQRPFLDRMIGGVDVFFAPNLNFIALSPKCPLVITAHDLSFEIYPETFSFKRRLWHLFVGPRKLFSRAQKILAVSQSTADDLMRIYSIQREKITVIYSGISEQFTIMNRNTVALMNIKKRYNLPYKFILFLGTFEPRKNIIALVRGYEMFRRLYTSENSTTIPQLILVGSSGWKEESLKKEIRKSSFCKDIRRIGFISQEDKPGLYNLATVFVYPSFYEGFGFPLAEAMKCGKPSITSNNSSLGEIAQKGALYIDPFRPEEIGFALLELFQDKELFSEMSQRASLAISRFSWRKCAKETHNILKDAAKH
jgi:glycosyltransferase involved in cell wall biosynthesis